MLCGCLYNDAKSDLFALSVFLSLLSFVLLSEQPACLSSSRCSLVKLSLTSLAQILENSVVLCDNGAHKLTCLCENLWCQTSSNKII